MKRYTVVRSERQVRPIVTWADDIVIEWAGSEAVCKVRAVFDYADGEARLIVRRGPDEIVLADGLRDVFTCTREALLTDGDEVVLQWRARVPTAPVISDVAELTVEGA